MGVEMGKVFGYPQFDETGEKILTTYDNDYREMLMDIRVYRMETGDIRTFLKSGEETAVLLLRGRVLFEAGAVGSIASAGATGEGATGAGVTGAGATGTGAKGAGAKGTGAKGTGATDTGADLVGEARRRDVFSDGPWCVHVCAGTKVTVKALEASEVLVQSTRNTTIFDSKLYCPADAPFRYSSVGKFGDVAKRQVNTIFDHEIAPWSNMVLGEVLNDPGNWSGYLPHSHPQPETYYFLFDRPEGFGASFVGDEVFKSVDGSFSAIPGGKLHPQAVAPGFRMYTCWMIRHLEGNPWNQTDRNEDARYVWMHDAKF
jgi:5-deoxy-glucuronate isomerase